MQGLEWLWKWSWGGGGLAIEEAFVCVRRIVFLVTSGMGRHMKRLVGRAFFFLLGTLFYCEFFVYYLVLWQCSYPSSPLSSTSMRAMVLADTHLLGSRKGHWFDKLRREWQMHRFWDNTEVWILKLPFQGFSNGTDLFQSTAHILPWWPFWRGPLVPSSRIWLLCWKVPKYLWLFNELCLDFTPCFRRVKRPTYMFCLATMTWAFIMPSVLIWIKGSRLHSRPKLCSWRCPSFSYTLHWNRWILPTGYRPCPICDDQQHGLRRRWLFSMQACC